jgi:hypothetical protein
MAENRISGKYGTEGGTQRIPDKPVSVLSPPGLVSILIPCCGMLEYTKLSVPRIYTRVLSRFVHPSFRDANVCSWRTEDGHAGNDAPNHLVTLTCAGSGRASPQNREYTP